MRGKRRISYHVAYRRTFHVKPPLSERRPPEWVPGLIIGILLGVVVGSAAYTLYQLLGI